MLHHGEMIAWANENEYLYQNIVFWSTVFVSFKGDFFQNLFYCNKIDLGWFFLFQEELYVCSY